MYRVFTITTSIIIIHYTAGISVYRVLLVIHFTISVFTSNTAGISVHQ